MNNNKPIIEKIELTEEQKQDIRDILDGKPSAKLLKSWVERGVNINNGLKYYHPRSLSNRIDLIKKKYFKGLCHVCQKFPLYKVRYKMVGISLVEYYCDNCFIKSGIK